MSCQKGLFSIVISLTFLLSVQAQALGVVFTDDFEADQGWVVNPKTTDTASAGVWERGQPGATISNGGSRQLSATVSGTYDLSTGPIGGSAGTHDVDGGVTSIRSPSITLPALAGNEVLELSFSYYLSHNSNASGADYFRVSVEAGVGGVGTTLPVYDDEGASGHKDAVWVARTIDLSNFAGQSITLLFEAADEGSGSLIEAAVDDVKVETVSRANNIFYDDFETDQSWTVNPNGTDTATTGLWERANPETTAIDQAVMQLGGTTSGLHNLVTGGVGGSAGAYDIDGGITTIHSPSITLPTLSGSETLELILSYYFAHNNTASVDDYLRITVMGSSNTVILEELGDAATDSGSWETLTTNLDSYAGQMITLLIEATDGGAGSISEAAIDDVRIIKTGSAGGGNTAPTITITSPTILSYLEGEQINFVGTANDAEDGNISSGLQWTSDKDGLIGTTGSFNTSNLSVGAHVITASVTDSGSLQATESINIEITQPANTAPVVAITGPADGSTYTEGDSITFTATATDAEDDDASLVIQWSSSIDVAIGSGSPLSLNTLSLGTHTITASVTDSGSITDTETMTVTVTVVPNTAPVANNDAGTTTENTPITIDPRSNDTDGDSDPLTITGVTQGANGNVTFTDTDVTYTPNTDYIGSDNFTYTISDGNGGTDTATITITVNEASVAPVAADDAATTTEDTAITIAPLVNDTDGNNDPLTITAVTQGGNGSVTFTSTDITYTPNTAYTGTDTFDYTISDGNGGADTATITVTVNEVPVAPVAVDDAATTTEDTAITIDPLVNDTDGNNDPLTITGVTQGTNGSVTFTSADVTYTSNTGYTGTDTFDYTISDGNGGTDTATVTMTVNAIAIPPAPPAPFDVESNLTSLVSQAEIDATDTVGSVGGSFRVDESGAATYSVPIATVKGTAGVVPQISLNYSSQAGNGLMGKGWSIEGLSAVTRCRQTLSQDKSAKAITWSVEDRFCLDGQRLLLETGANYGAVGATYKTEIDSFAKITSVAGSNGHPDYFTVERKDGSTSTYGGTGDIDAEQVARNADTTLTSNTLTWALDRFEDSVGNSIEFEYADDINGHRISQIKYAYGSTASHGAHIDFLYEARTDGISGFLSGYKFKNNRRLQTIKSYNGTTAVREYNLSYQSESTVNSDKTSRLASLQECSGSNCLPATTFAWSKPQVGFSPSASSNVTLSTQSDRTTSKYIPADINGDGIQDIIWQEPDYDDDGKIHDQYWKYVIGNASGQFSNPVQFRSDTANLDIGAQAYPWDIIDYNHDGYMDVVLYSAGGWKVFLSKLQTNGTWRITSSFLSLPIPVKHAVFADLNSDGLIDVAYKVGTNIYKKLMVVDATQAVSSNHYYKFGSQLLIGAVDTGIYPDPTAVPWWNPSSLGDVNGDGLSDVKFPFTACIGFYIYSTCTIAGSTHVSNGNDYQTGGVNGTSWRDINGDGYPDSLTNGLTSVGLGGFYYSINKGVKDSTLALGYYIEGDIYEGTTTTALSPMSKIVQATGSIADPGIANEQFVDYNSDGYSDILWHDYFAKKLKVRLWNSSTESFDPAMNIRTTSGNRYESHLFYDVNGDGNQDYILFRSNKLYTYLGNADGQTNDVITNITNGLGAETEITYTPLSDDSHYKTISYNEPDTIFDSYNMPSVSAFYTALNSDWSASLPAGSETLGLLSPTIEFNAPTLVVARVDSSAPTAGANPGSINTSAMSAISYYYGEARLQAAGRGFLGFERIKTKDEQTGVETTTTYRQDWPFIGHPLKTEVRTAQGHLLSEAENTWKLKNYATAWANTAKNNGTSALGALQPYIAQSVEKTYALESNGSQAGSLLQTVTTDNVYDNYGNPTSISVTTNGGGKNFQKVTTNHYLASGLDSTYSQEKGRLSETTVVSKRDEDGDTSYELSSTRTSTFSYHTSGYLKGLLATETIEPNNALLTLTTTHSYDSFGNKVRAATTDANSNTRCDVDTALYDTLGRYVDTNYDCLGRKVSDVVSRNEYGEPLEVKTYLDASAANSVSTYYAYTPRGIRYLEGSDAGAWKATTLSDCSGGGSCPAGAVYYAKVTAAGGGESREYFDVLGRSMLKASVGFDGQWIYANTEYDNLGRVKRKSEPYYNGSSASHWSTMTYDILGRVTNLTLPDGSQGSTAYNGYTTVTTNDLGHNKTEIKNTLGETVQVTDNLGGHAYYHYDAQGNMTSMVDNAGNTSTISYDVLGRKTAMNDPDKGAWAYDYNGFGELIEQTDAKLQKSVMTYDTLGRMKTRIDYTATQMVEGNTVWSYDTAPNGLGQLDNVEDSVSGYLKAVEYDSLGRTSKTVTSLGVSGADGDHYEKVTYDQYGRTHQVFDAARNDDSYITNGIVTLYNQYGYQHKLADATYINDQPRSIYQEVLAMNARGQVTSEKLGNNATTARTYDDQTGRIQSILATTMLGTSGDIQDLSYQWDTVGNLSYRKEQSGNKDLEENFLYDGLNRLTTYHVVGQTAKTISYDLLGNITNKSDVGNYSYGTANTSSAGDAGPHAVINAGGTTYSYDNNGNNTSSSDGRTIAYTTFDKAKTVTKGAHTTIFAYGADRARYKRTDTNASGTKTTLYIGSVEKITNVDGTKQVKRTIGGVAIITLNQDNQGNTQSTDTNYLYKDHLGSLDIITDATGAIAQNGGEMSFDAFGQRRDAISWEDMSDQVIAAGFGIFSNPVTTRGFTGHEMADEVGIIHMNGRIYDPKLARFLQADPFVQSPTDTQMLNRYSYVRNNPLNATDPSGYFLSLAVAAVLTALEVDIVITAIAVGLTAFGETLAAGGNFGDALIAGVSAAAMSYTGTKFAMSGGGFSGVEALQFGTLGGITSSLQGGKFGHGFISAGAGAYFGGKIGPQVKGNTWANLGKTATRMVLSGTISKVTGGKFANGATSAAFSNIITTLAQSFSPKTALSEYTQEEINSMSDGEWVFPDGRSTNLSTYDEFRTNGIMGNRGAAQVTANRTENPVFFNPSKGPLHDVAQSFEQKFGLGEDMMAKEFALSLRGIDHPITIIAHSQGTLTVANAASYGLPSGASYILKSPALSFYSASAAINSVGGTLTYDQPLGDAANLWAGSINPFKTASGIADIFRGGRIHIGNGLGEK